MVPTGASRPERADNTGMPPAAHPLTVTHALARLARTLLPLLVLLPCGAALAATVAVTDAAGRPIRDAVVSVVGEAAAAAPEATAAIQQVGRRFDPIVTVVRIGTAVAFPNNDTVRHHVYSFSPAKRFEIKLYVGTPAQPIVFDKPGIVTLGCNIHDRMLAWVVVVDSPHFAKTDAAGVAVLNVPPGRHRLRVWHPGLGEEAPPFEASLILDAARLVPLRLAR